MTFTSWVFRCFILSFLLLAAVMSLLHNTSAMDVPDDTEMTGTLRDMTIDAWGNITVPEGGRLELWNVRLVFHVAQGQSRGINALRNSTLVMGGDDSGPTNVTSEPAPWFLCVENATRLEVTNSSLANLGGNEPDPMWTLRNVSTVEVGTVQVSRSDIWIYESGLFFSARTVTVDASVLAGESDYTTFKFECWSATFSGCDIRVSTMLIEAATAASFEDCNISETYIVSEASRAIGMTRVRFQKAYLYITSEKLTGGQGSINLTGCDFSATTNQFRGRIVNVVNCDFRGIVSQLNMYGSLVCITRCEFTEKSRGISIDESHGLTVEDTRFNDCGATIFAEVGTGPVELADLVISECLNGVSLYSLNNFIINSVNLTKSIFQDFDNTAVTVGGSIDINVRQCVFTRVVNGISSRPFIEGIYGSMVVNDCRFNGCFQDIVWGGDLRVIGCTMDGGKIDRKYSTGIGTMNNGMARDVMIYIRYVNVTGKDLGLSLTSNPGTSVIATLMDIVISRVHTGVLVDGLTRVSLLTVSVNESTVGVRVNGTTFCSLIGLELDGMEDGLVVSYCHDVLEQDLRIGNVTSWYMDLNHIGKSTWRMDTATELHGYKVRIAGKVEVMDQLILRDSRFEFLRSERGTDGILVMDGGRLLLEGSALTGDPAHGYAFRVSENSTLMAVDSRITNYGMDGPNPRNTGLFLEGGNHSLVNVTLRGLVNGVVANGCRIRIDSCHIEAERTGIYAMGADMDLVSSLVLGREIAVALDQTPFTGWNCTLHGEDIAMDCRGAEAQMTSAGLISGSCALMALNTIVRLVNCTVDTRSDVLQASSSTVELWFMVLASPLDRMGTIGNGTVSLFDTVYKGDWTFIDGKARMDENWHHDISAFYTWSGEPASGLEVSVRQSQGAGGTEAKGIVDGEGRLERVWVTGTRWTDEGGERFYPYSATVDSGEFRAWSTLPEDTWSELTLEVRDVVGPKVEIESPVNGSMHATTTMTFQGTVQDDGSGVDMLFYSLGGTLWETMEEPNDGRWLITLEVVQGTNTLLIRAKDKDAVRGEAEVWFIIDTDPPLVTFVSPAPRTVTSKGSIQLEGLAVLGEGTPLAWCSVGGIDVELEPDGTFEVVVDLTSEGENTFVVEVQDMAGNTGRDSIAVIRDSTPPSMDLSDIPPYARDPFIIIQGRLSDPLDVDLVINGRLEMTSIEGEFSVNISLVIGRNMLVIEAIDALGNTVRSDHVVIQDGLLNASLVSPQQGDVVHEISVTVSVSTDPGTWVRVLDRTEWTYTSNGSLDLLVELVEDSENALVVEFHDAANNTALQTVTVIHVPLPEEHEGGIQWWVILLIVIAAAIAAGIWREVRRRD